jgi:hypothetical protein
VIGMVEGYRHGRQRQSVRGVPRAAVLRPLATVVGLPARKNRQRPTTDSEPEGLELQDVGSLNHGVGACVKC